MQLLMESVAEIAEVLRRSTVSQNPEAHQLVQHNSPSAESERTVSHTPSVRRKRKRRPTCGVQGSKPNLVENNEERTKKMNKLLQTKGVMAEDAGKSACLAEFQWRLFAHGFSEGSWKHASGCSKECNRSCAGFCKNDGNPYTYARYMGLFFDHGIVARRSDFFVPSALARAREFAVKRANECASKAKKWNEMNDEKQQSLVTKIAGNIMHGFTDFKWYPNTELGYFPIHVAQEKMQEGVSGGAQEGCAGGEPEDDEEEYEAMDAQGNEKEDVLPNTNIVVGNANSPSFFYKCSE